MFVLVGVDVIHQWQVTKAFDILGLFVRTPNLSTGAVRRDP